MTPQQIQEAMRNKEHIARTGRALTEELNVRRVRLGKAMLRFVASTPLKAFSQVKLSEPEGE